MAKIHRTTITPTKLELLAAWLPLQPWYVRGDSPPALSRAGGWRLDDPAGAVGIEFCFVADVGAARTTVYNVPLTYRDGALRGAEAALVGTAEHGVLGRRWVYDATRDTVAVTQFQALLRGEVLAQKQNESDSVDPTVVVRAAVATELEVVRVLSPGDGPVTATWTLPDGRTETGPVLRQRATAASLAVSSGRTASVTHRPSVGRSPSGK